MSYQCAVSTEAVVLICVDGSYQCAVSTEVVVLICVDGSYQCTISTEVVVLIYVLMGVINVQSPLRPLC